MNVKEVVQRASQHKTIVPAFNIPYLPKLEFTSSSLQEHCSHTCRG